MLEINLSYSNEPNLNSRFHYGVRVLWLTSLTSVNSEIFAKVVFSRNV